MRSSRALLPAATLAFAIAACDSPPPPAVDSPQFAQAGADEDSKIRIGYAVAPVPLDLKGKNPALVGLGSYLVHTHACSDCHTNPPFADGGNPLLGQPEQTNADDYLAGGTPFGPFISRNLTPDADGRPARLTLEQFLQVLNTGADLKGREPFVPSEANDLLQVMPWPFFKDLTGREQRAIYEYLRAIPCAGSATRCGE